MVMVTPETLDPAPAEVPLRRNRNFQLLWSGSGLALLGREITDLVYPLVVLAVTGSPAWAGAFGATQMAVSLLAGLPAGKLADTHDQRLLLIIMETVRAIATTSVLVAVLHDAITLPHLLAVAAIVGAVQPLGGSARMLLVRAVVPPRQLTAALTQEEVRSHAAALGGPSLGGLLYATATVLPFLATAVSFVVSLVCALFVRPPARARKPTVDGDRRMLAGLAQLWKVPILRHSTMFAAVLNAVSAPLVLVVIVVLTRDGASPGTVGLTMAGLAVGGLAGTVLVRPLHDRLTPGALMLWLGGTAVLLIAALSLPFGAWWLAIALFLLGLGGPSMRVLMDILIFRQVPDEQRGRTVTAFMTVLGVGSSAGMLASGLLVEHLSAQAAILTLATVLAIALGVSISDRRIRSVQWPTETENRS